MLSIFGGFDFGKGLLKQLEQLKKLPLAQQQKKEQQILKVYEKFVSDYMGKLNNPGNTNPANLKFGAEALVEAAVQLREAKLSYRVYAEMVARSRKVPVVPGLAALVDKLLELPTDSKEERISLLNWRIVTGSMRPERQLAYLAERAELTGAVSDWKDYSWNVSQLISKGAIAASDQLALDALNNLIKNKSKLGDRLAPVQMMMAEALIAQGKLRQAEIQLTDLATEAKQLPEKFNALVGELIARYPETNWMLQQMLLAPTIQALLEGKLNWTQAAERLDRARGHAPQLIEFLLGHEKLCEEDRLGVYCLERICSLERHEADPNYDKWRDIYRAAGRELPSGAAEVVEKAVATGHLTKRDVAKVASIELGPSLLACQERAQVIQVLNSNIPTETLSAQRVDEINSELANPNLSDWVVEETRLWLAERLARLGRLDSAARQLTSIPVLSEKHAAQLYPRIATMFSGSTPPPQIQSLLARMSLLGGDYHGAFAAAQGLPADNPARGQLLSALEEWILAQIDAPADMLLVLAQTQRLSHGDPSAGLQAATTASLLAPDNDAIQNAYRSWEHALAPEIVYAQRAHQAAYLAEQQRKMELLPVALDAIEKLESSRGDEPSRESIALLEGLRPLLLSLPLEEQEAVVTRWARLFLLVSFKQNDESTIEQAIKEVTPMLRSEVLNELLGEFASALAPNQRLQVEYEPAVRGGHWEKVLELCQASSGELISSLVPLSLFCQHCPASSLNAATTAFGQILASRGDDAGELQLIQGMQERLRSDSQLPGASELQATLAELLLVLCAQPYEPAIRYRLEMLRASGDLDAIAPELLALAQTGDEEALEDISKLFERRLVSGEEPELTKEMALALAAHSLESDPKVAVDYLTRAGRAINDAQWAVGAIGQLELSTETAEGLSLIAELALQQGDVGKAQAVLQRLSELGAIEQAQKLADLLTTAQPDTPAAMQSLLLVQLGSPQRDLPALLENLIKYVEMLKAEGGDTATGLAALASASDNSIGYDPSREAQEFRLALALLRGDQFQVSNLMAELVRHGAGAAEGLLALLKRLGVDETNLPGNLLVGWSRALFAAGRTDEALSNLISLRDEVEDFPEYISLLEEIKDKVGGAGPSLQLAEAYLKVSLWQRSAEEYQVALLHDPSCAQHVLAQLREHQALAPNPMKYPLHVAGLTAVVNSTQHADWAWAISALSWLVPRWDPSELASIAASLWQQGSTAMQLQPEELVQLALHLHQLAVRQQDYAAALDYLTAAWELSPAAGPELQAALDSFDRGRLPADPLVQEKLLRFELQAALASNDSAKVLAAAQRLAEVSQSGRAAADEALSQFQSSADNPVQVLLQRMRLLDISDSAQRSGFVTELEAIGERDIPADQQKLIVNTLFALLRQLPDDEQLQLSLLRGLHRYGDQARAWQFALQLAPGKGAAAAAALSELEQAAADEFTHGTREALVAALLARGDQNTAATELLKLDPGQAQHEALQLGEALLESQPAVALRAWLVAAYRAQGNELLAAEHVLWAQSAGSVLASDWLAESGNPELQLRAGLLAAERAEPGAQDLLSKALASDGLSERSAACGAWRLAQLAEAAGRLSEAQQLLARVTASGLAFDGMAELQQRLELALREQRLGALREKPDREERTLELASVLCELGDLPAAIGELQSGIGRGQTSPQMYIALGECFTSNGDLNLGRRAFADVLRKLETADDAPVELRLRANYGLADAEEALGNLQGAIGALENILVTSGNYRDTRSRLDGLYASQRGGGTAPAPPPPAQQPATAAPAAASAKDEILDEIMALLDLDEEAK